MNDASCSQNESDVSLSNAWDKSRHGAWAGGGFDYQHLISTLILVRQWAGLAPSGYLVPEGLEDCVIELPQQRIWLQVKSRNSGLFTEGEVESIFKSIDKRSTTLRTSAPTSSVVVLSQAFSGQATKDLEQIFDNSQRKVIHCSSPEDEILSLLTKVLKTAEIISEGILSDLYRLVATTSRKNAPVSYDERLRISTTEVERRIFERLEAEDPSAIDEAFASRVLESIDFQTPVHEPSFYLGVKAVPGHVAAGHIMPRSQEVKVVTKSLRNRRHVLIVGPSGAGKSALMWLSASLLASEFRWYLINSKGTVNDVDSIVRFVRARRPTKLSPIGIAFDDVCSTNSGLWDLIVQELRGLPDVYVIGSVRIEDIDLIVNQSDTGFYHVRLDEKLAESIWRKLSSENCTEWLHWKEPFEQSEGLMLEYVHILTQGIRLAAVIAEQVRQREIENRTDELAIIRCTAELSCHGGDVEVARLLKLLDIPKERFGFALKRLLEEHLIREQRPGVLGGLHSLRSNALSKAAHDELVYSRLDSMWQGLMAVNVETLPRVVQSIFNDLEGQSEEDSLRKLSGLLASSDNNSTWTAILTGLGLATLERYVISFMTILEQQGVPRGHWSLAGMFFDPSTDVPEMSAKEQWSALKGAVEAFRASRKSDLRRACLEFLPKGVNTPTCKSVKEANQLLSSAIPFVGGKSIPIFINPQFTVEDEQSIEGVSLLLSTAFSVNQSIAIDLVEKLGGEEKLFALFYKTIPWVSAPIIEADGKHGRTVRSDWFLLAEEYQNDPHKTIVGICQILVAISPSSNAVACDAVDSQGRVIKLKDNAIVTKKIPRKNLPAKSRVSWNKAFHQRLLILASDNSLTNYTQRMSIIVIETEKLFRSYSEKWICGKITVITGTMVASINKLVDEANSLVYAVPKPSVTSMIDIPKESETDDNLGALLTGVLGNLVPRINLLPAEGGEKGVAVFAGRLAEQAFEQLQSGIWRTTLSPPFKALQALADRLNDVSAILHQMASDKPARPHIENIKIAKKAPLNKSVSFVARRCRLKADQRLQNKLRKIEKALEVCGCKVNCWTRSIDESDSPYWPALEIAVLVHMTDFEMGNGYLNDSILAGKDIFQQHWPFRVVPIIDGVVLAPFAMQATSGIQVSEDMVLPDLDFEKNWREHIEYPFHSSGVSDDFDKAMSSCMQLSGIINCSAVEETNAEVERVTSSIINMFKMRLERLRKAASVAEIEILDWALDMVETTWNQLVVEFEAAKVDGTISNPLYENIYTALSGQDNKWLNELAGIRLLLQQAEIRGVISNQSI